MGNRTFAWVKMLIHVPLGFFRLAGAMLRLFPLSSCEVADGLVDEYESGFLIMQKLYVT